MKINKLEDSVPGAPLGLNGGAPFAPINGDMKTADKGGVTEEIKKKKKKKKQ
jgi:hypothetical protein